MNKIGALVILSLTSLSSVAMAADLINSDNKAYKFKFFDGNISSSRSIRARGSIYGLCTPNSSCKIVLNGKTSPSFGSNARVKIEGGVVKIQ